MKKPAPLLLIITCGFLFLAGGSFAEEFCVDTAAELQSALWDADGNDEDDIIRVQQGTYDGNFYYHSGENKNLTILGGYTSGCADRILDPANTILDGGETDRAVELYGPFSSADFLIEGFTIQNGLCEFSGGGIYVFTSTETTDGGTITIKDNIIKNNTANLGGGIYANSKVVTGSAYSTGDVIIVNNIITDNIATGKNGGGVDASVNSYSGAGGNVILINNIITGNDVLNYSGGGIHLTSSTSSGTYGTITITNNTITGNNANDFGGGVSLDRNGTINCYNNIIWGNTATTGDDISLVGTGGTTNGLNNNYDDSNMFGEWDSESGNINVDPRFVNENEGNYKLKPRSPCIDAGNNSAPNIPDYDIEGNERLLDGDRDGTATVDMGAYENLPHSIISHILLLLD